MYIIVLLSVQVPIQVHADVLYVKQHHHDTHDTGYLDAPGPMDSKSPGADAADAASGRSFDARRTQALSAEQHN